MGRLNQKSRENVNDEINTGYKGIFQKAKKPKILICTPEITELPEGMGNAANLVASKGGGLGDISASLVKHLNDNQDFDLHIVLPKYDRSIKHMAKITNQQIDRLAVVLSGQGIHLVNDSAFSYIDNPYADNRMHTPVRRSLVFQRHIINNLLDFIKPDVVHCNDWMTGLIPAAARSKGIKSLFTLHNIFSEKKTMMEIEFSGIRPLDFSELLYFERFPENIKEKWNQHFETNPVNFTASAILASDYFNTVSETFLEELRENIFPDIVSKPIFDMIKMKCEANRAIGILNAPSDGMNPEYLRDIKNFNSSNVIIKKAENKILFQKRMGLPIEANIPIFFWPNRLYYQKGPDLLINHLEYFLQKYKMQIAVVANGDKKLEEKLKLFSKKYPQVAYQNFDESLNNMGKAASDFILMPSRYEPCGLPQMEALRFGTLPIVRSTGGLKDTVHQLDIEKNTGNGFTFMIADKAGLEYGILKAIEFYNLDEMKKKTQIERIMKSAKKDFNLKNTAEKYINIYQQLIKEKRDEDN